MCYIRKAKQVQENLLKTFFKRSYLLDRDGTCIRERGREKAGAREEKETVSLLSRELDLARSQGLGMT